jgi:hypothetical protein
MPGCNDLTAGVYRHYKGGFYQCLGVGEHTETAEIVVVYVSLTGSDLSGPRMRVRPMNGPNGWNTPVNGQPRFSWVGNAIND